MPIVIVPTTQPATARQSGYPETLARSLGLSSALLRNTAHQSVRTVAVRSIALGTHSTSVSTNVSVATHIDTAASSPGPIQELDLATLSQPALSVPTPGPHGHNPTQGHASQVRHYHGSLASAIIPRLQQEAGQPPPNR